MRAVALSLTLLLATSAWADGPVDGGVPADAAPPPADAASPLPDAAPSSPSSPSSPSPAAPLPARPPSSAAPYSLLGASPPPQPDVPAHARPTPLYRSPLFWTAVVLGAGAVAAIAAGAGMAATYHPRYGLVSF